MIIDPGMKTPLKKVKGFGSAKSGTDHFWQQRATAVANLPLMAFMVGFVIWHLGATRAEVIASLHHPIVALLLIMGLASAFWHMRLGLQVVIEDYIHSGFKFVAVIAVRLGCYGVALIGIVATLRIAFGG